MPRPSVDGLLGDLAVSHLQRRAAEAEAAAADAESSRLASQVVALEADKRALRLEVERLRRRCADLQQANATLGPRLDEAQAELKEALVRERSGAVLSVQRQLLAAEAMDSKTRAKQEADDSLWFAQGLQRTLAAKQAEVDALRVELGEERLRGGHDKARHDRALAENTELTSALAKDREARLLLEERSNSLEARVAALEQELGTTVARCAALAAEAEAHRTARRSSEETNRRLRLDLQEVLSQAIRGGERPFYIGSNSATIAPGIIVDSAGNPLDGLLDPLSPTSYLRPGSAARDPPPPPPRSPRTPSKRAQILNERHDALGRIDALSQAPAAG